MFVSQPGQMQLQGLVNGSQTDSNDRKEHSEGHLLLERKLTELGWLFDDNDFLCDYRHKGGCLMEPYVEEKRDTTWRLKERMKTVGVALIVCLNIGVDPPDVLKSVPCARKECWIDPLSAPKQKALELIGAALQQQYEKWQAKAKYKQSLDPTPEDIKRVCTNLRRSARVDRLLVHYNGHGVPRPTEKGELWAFGRNYSHYMPVSVYDLRHWLGEPCIFVLDCNGAGTLLPFFEISATVLEEEAAHSQDRVPIASDETTTDDGESFSPNNTIVLAACAASENLPMSADFPADIFAACLTTPIPLALRWFIKSNPFSMTGVDLDIADEFPGKVNDRKTPLGELNWVFTAITDTIAWNTLPSALFQRLFRQDLLVASLFRNFLLAKRIMTSMNAHPLSLPHLPDTNTHSLWLAWDLAVECALTNVIAERKGTLVAEPRSTLVFFTEHLTAFEVWLKFGTGTETEAPAFLPILLQVLLSQAHRIRALELLQKYLALGPHAVNLALLVGIFPYVLKLLQSPARDIRQVLVCIWASILAFDPTCRQDLVRDNAHLYFIQYLPSPDMPHNNRVKIAFVLAELMNGYPEGQKACFAQRLHHTCVHLLGQADGSFSSLFRRWLCLCLGKLADNFPWGKHIMLTEGIHMCLVRQLRDPNVEVRAALVTALGCLFGGGGHIPQLHTSKSEDGGVRLQTPMEADMEMALNILHLTGDGSAVVRRECLCSLVNFVGGPAHIRVFMRLAQYMLSGPGQGTISAEVLTERQNTELTSEVQPPTPEQCLSSQILRAQFSGIVPEVKIEGMFRTVLECVSSARVNFAETYVKTWLTVRQMQLKDPHPTVSKAAAALVWKIHECLVNYPIGESEQAVDPNASTQAENVNFRSQSMIDLRQLSDERTHTLANTIGGETMGQILPVHGLPPRHIPPSLVRQGSSQNTLGSYPHQHPHIHGHTSTSIPDRDVSIVQEGPSFKKPLDPCLASYLYEWSRKLFATPPEGYEPKDDPLSEEGHERLYRVYKREEMTTEALKIMRMYGRREKLSDYTDSEDGRERTDEEKRSNKIKLDQYTVLDIPHAEMTSNVLFHAFEDVVVVANGADQISLWSLEDGVCRKTFSNTPAQIYSNIYKTLGQPCARITGLHWINETRSSLLCVCADDGSVHVWRDLLEPAAQSNTLAAALNVLDDVTPSTRGSGLVTYWLQHTGTLIAGGNSKHIKLWDMSREACACTLPTRIDSCVTCIAGESYAPDALTHAHAPSPWFIFGCGEGTVRLFDTRVHNGGGLSAREHHMWVVSAHLCKGAQEAVTGSVTGNVKFWDLRMMQSFKTIELQRSPMTALTVHNCAPIMASGSRNQFIKLVTLAGDPLSVIRYHDGFLGQRIGPISCLAFHPYRILLAAGATDSIVSIYANSD